MENALISREAMISMAETRTLDELYGILEDNGIASENGAFGDKSFEKGLHALLDTIYLDVLGSVPSPELFTVLTYPYDCVNLKTALKCAEKGVSPDGLLLPYGTVSPEEVKDAVLKRSFSVFPTNMAEAATKAIEVFARSRNPQDIDLILDKALFFDMKESVENNPVGFFRSLLEVKADTVNVLSYMRIRKIGASKELFERAFVSGGSLDISHFEDAFENGTVSLANALRDKYEKLSQLLLTDNVTLYDIEKAFDSIYTDLIRSARSVQTGAEVVAGYAAAIEKEVQSVRILITGKKLSVSPEKLIERLGEYYV